MKLIDTSCGIHALRRKGDPVVKARVTAILENEEAAWCQIVRLELWRGAENAWDRELLGYLADRIKMLAISHDVWQRAIYFGQTLRADGITVPLPDLVIFSCGCVHNVEIAHVDKHFDLLRNKFPLGL